MTLVVSAVDDPSPLMGKHRDYCSINRQFVDQQPLSNVMEALTSLEGGPSGSLSSPLVFGHCGPASIETSSRGNQSERKPVRKGSGKRNVADLRVVRVSERTPRCR